MSRAHKDTVVLVSGLSTHPSSCAQSPYPENHPGRSQPKKIKLFAYRLADPGFFSSDGWAAAFETDVIVRKYKSWVQHWWASSDGEAWWVRS